MLIPGNWQDFKTSLIRHFMLATNVVGGGIWEFMNNADGPAFLERELVGLGVDGYRLVRVRDHASGTVPIYMFREHLTHFSNVKSLHCFYIRVGI